MKEKQSEIIPFTKFDKRLSNTFITIDHWLMNCINASAGLELIHRLNFILSAALQLQMKWTLL